MKKDLIYITAGEESGDLLGSSVIRALKTEKPDLKFKGIGGDLMITEGLDPVFRTDELGFMGFLELIKHVFFIKKIFKTMLNKILEDDPAVVLMIDFSEFNLKLATKLKEIKPDIKIVKYVSPQIWASRPGRINRIEKAYDCLCCILPFEPELYKDKAIDCRFVGHPLLDKYETKLGFMEFYEKFSLYEDKSIISVFPGSRKQEIKKHMPVLREFMKQLLSERDDIQFGICKSSNISDENLNLGELSGKVRIISSEYQWDLMENSSIVLCKSGTTTLQTAITGTPSIVFYKVNPISFFIAKKIVTTKYISLPNIIAGKPINPELIQSDFSVENLSYDVKLLLDNEAVYEMRQKELKLVKGMLGEKGAGKKVAEAVLMYLEM